MFKLTKNQKIHEVIKFFLLCVCGFCVLSVVACDEQKEGASLPFDELYHMSTCSTSIGAHDATDSERNTNVSTNVTTETNSVVEIATDTLDTDVSVESDMHDTNTVIDSAGCASDKNVHVHSYDKSVVQPSCTAKGYTTYTCSCGNSYSDNYKSALGHSFGDWTVTKAATTSAEGERFRTCSRCTVKETSIIEKVKLPGCAGRGIDVYEVQRLALEYVGTLENAVADPTLVGVDRGGYAGWTLRVLTYAYDTQDELLNEVKECLFSEYKTCIKSRSVVKLHVWIDRHPSYPGEYFLYILYQ